MNTSKMIVTNGTISFDLNTEISKAEMFKIAVESGFEGGKTSFMNLLNGKTSEVKGFSIKPVVIEVAKETNLSDFNPTLVLANLSTVTGMEVKIKEAKTETYGTVNGKYGRTQLNPLAKGGYSLMFFPKKGWHETEVQALLNDGEIKGQYLKLGKKTEAETIALLNTLA